MSANLVDCAVGTPNPEVLKILEDVDEGPAVTVSVDPEVDESWNEFGDVEYGAR